MNIHLNIQDRKWELQVERSDVGEVKRDQQEEGYGKRLHGSK